VIVMVPAASGPLAVTGNSPSKNLSKASLQPLKKALVRVYTCWPTGHVSCRMNPAYTSPSKSTLVSSCRPSAVAPQA
jgi:hypothetical protein